MLYYIIIATIFTLIIILILLLNPDQVYLINLDKRIDRLHTTLPRLIKRGYNVKRISAMVGSNISNEELQKLVTPQSFSHILSGVRTQEQNLSKGAVGCFLSHAQLWKKLVHSNKEYIIIFEDDVEPQMDAAQLKEVINSLPRDWDMLQFGGIFSILSESRPFARLLKFISTRGYAISKNCAIKLLDIYIPMYKQLDWWLSDLSMLGILQLYGLTENGFTVDPMIAESDIQTPYVGLI